MLLFVLMEDSQKIVFLGSGEFAVPSLEALLRAQEEVALVVSQPAKKAGRGQKFIATPLAQEAQKNNLRVITPAKISKEVREEIAALKPQFLVVAAFGKILRQSLFSIPPLGTVNVHASLLPKFRGASPIQQAILTGEKISGVSTMLIEAGLDSGPILLQQEMAIAADDNAASLEKKLAKLGGKLLLETLSGLRQKLIKPRRQDQQLASLAPMLHKNDGLIDWSKGALELERQFRAFDPWPGAYTILHGKILRIFAAELVKAKSAPAGQIIALEKQGPVVATGAGALLLKEVQLAGKRRIGAADFARGFRLAVGTTFENR